MIYDVSKFSSLAFIDTSSEILSNEQAKMSSDQRLGFNLSLTTWLTSRDGLTAGNTLKSIDEVWHFPSRLALTLKTILE